MSDGPDRPSRGPKKSGDFGWLYGGKSAGGEEPPPDATRAIPTQQRPGRPGSSSSGQPPATRVMSPAERGSTPMPPPSSTEYGGGRRGLRLPSWRPSWSPSWKKVVLGVVLLWLVYTIAVPMVVWQQGDPIKFEPGGDRPDDQPGTTYLMVGSDSRAGLSKEERRKFNTGNPESSLADTIMMLHTGSGPNVLLSYPRDWNVDGAKINGYYNPGDPRDLVKALEGETGIRVDEYVEIGLGGVAGVVDAIGGIEICPKEKINDKKAGLNIKKGCQEADGEVALAYSRSRATARGDLDRVGRQREVVAAIGDKVLSPWTVLNPIRWWKLNNSVPDFFAFGDGTGRFDAGRWALAMTRVGDGKTCTMPVTDGSATTMDEERARPLFDAIIEDRADDITKQQCTAAGIAP